MTELATLPAGLIVTAPRYKRGRIAEHRRAMVLGLWNPEKPSSGYLVWFYTLGAPKAGATVAAAYAHEIASVAPIDRVSDRQLRGFVKALNGFDDGRDAWIATSREKLRRSAAEPRYGMEAPIGTRVEVRDVRGVQVDVTWYEYRCGCGYRPGADYTDLASAERLREIHARDYCPHAPAKR